MRDINEFIEDTKGLPALIVIPIGVVALGLTGTDNSYLIGWIVGLGAFAIPFSGILLAWFFIIGLGIPDDIVKLDPTNRDAVLIFMGVLMFLMPPILLLMIPVVLWIYFANLAFTVFFAIKGGNKQKTT